MTEIFEQLICVSILSSVVRLLSFLSFYPLLKKWYGGPCDFKPRPPAPKADALPTELSRNMCRMCPVNQTCVFFHINLDNSFIVQVYMLPVAMTIRILHGLEILNEQS